MKRYTLTLGAATSAGGKVIAASSHGSIDGVSIALEGDAIYCPACKTTGKIVCIGARVPEHWNGKQVGLSGDLCDCDCRPPPRLYACQTLRYQNRGKRSGDARAGCWPHATTGISGQH